MVPNHMKTSYILGAGASRHVGYPLASEMGPEMQKYLLSSSRPDYRVMGHYLADTFGQEWNIEDVITTLQKKREGTKLGVLSDALSTWFREIRKNPAPTYATFVDKLIQTGDTIITFNYDDSLERELIRAGKWDISYAYGFRLGSVEHPSDVLVLKLHGSVNWVASFLNGATGGATLITSDPATLGHQPVIRPDDLAHLRYSNFSGRVWKSGGAPPCLILPASQKKFFWDTSSGLQFTEFWTHIWSQAAKALERSDRIVICGYSMQEVDEDACTLLLQKPKKEAAVEIVSGSHSQRIAGTFGSSGFENVKIFEDGRGRFEDWVKQNTT